VQEKRELVLEKDKESSIKEGENGTKEGENGTKEDEKATKWKFSPKQRVARYFRKWKGEKFQGEVEYPTIRILIWSFIGSFVAISVVGIFHIYCFAPIGYVGWTGSMGAIAVLLYGSQSPLAQPRNVIGGNIISALVGVTMHYAFASYPSLVWLAGAFSVAISIVLMQLTKCLHPPAGATALIAASDSRMWNEGYLYVVVPIALGVITMVFVALVIMNIKLKYPKYWI